MSAYVIAIINETSLSDDIRAYLDQIDATLRPFAGRFVIHGGPYLRLEGEFEGDLVMIEFPDLELASHWYDSSAYQAIKPLRTANSSGTVFLAKGVPSDHHATDILA